MSASLTIKHVVSVVVGTLLQARKKKRGHAQVIQVIHVSKK
jgi:hypothetical protein